ncbi:MAG: hypothetical protein GWP14_07435, partial [Actinobacteria bacterium]|nr:hypothetical protein [Actinomycetota bacterium]
MKIERKTVLAIVVIWSVMLAPGIARADWVPQDGHKMHFPQLPDPNGWDVNISVDSMFDDWQCSQSGPVDDIHFWASWKGDVGNADPNQFNWIRVRIWSDMPAGPSTENPLSYSHPAGQVPIWEQYFSTTEDPQGTMGPLPDFAMRLAGSGDQGWFDPQPSDNQTVVPYDHQAYYQINFTDIPEPFQQEKDTIYWLDIHASVIDYENQELGWKTADLNAYPEPYTGNHFQDDAAYYWGGWQELIDPLAGNSLDLAFVITPEPVTMLVLALGLLPLLMTRRHRKT